MGRHHPHADANADADPNAHGHPDSEPRRHPGGFSVPERFARRFACTDIRIRAPIAERLSQRSTGHPFSSSKVIADRFPGEERLSVTRESLRSVDTEIPE